MDGLRDIRVSEEEVEEVLADEGEFRRWCRNRNRRRLADGTDCVSAYQTMDDYLVRLGTVETLDHKEIVYLSKRVQAGIHAVGRLEHEEVGKEEARRLGRLVEIGEMAREQLVISNIPLVLTLSKRYPRGEVPFIDFIQAGTTGLVRAIDLYDYKRGFKFSTYAAYWIRSGFQSAMEKEDGPMCLSYLASSRIRNMRYLILSSLEQSGRKPSRSEIAEELGTTEREVAILEQIAEPFRSLDEPISDGERELTLSDLVIDEEQVDFDGEFEREGLLREVDLLLDLLNHNDRFIVTHFYGIGGAEQMNAEQIGDCLGFTTRTVEVYMSAAIRKLRTNHRSQRAREYWEGA